MKIKIKHIGLIILSLIIITIGIIFIFRSRIIASIIPTVDQIGAIDIKLRNDTSYISTKFSIKNNTFFKIEIGSIKYEISLLDKTLLKDRMPIGAALSGYGKDTVDFSLKIPYASIIKTLKKQGEKSDSINYNLSLKLQISTIFGISEIPIDKSGKIKIPQPPEIEVIDIKFKKFRLKSILADAKIKIINNSSISLTIKELSYSMNFKKEGQIEGNFNDPVIIKPNDITFINIPIEINPKNLGKTLFDIIFNKDIYDYTITLKAVLESPEPLNETFHINMSKKGKMALKK